MIPKILHLCWFGKGEYPPLVKMCIESWKRFLPNYEIMIWNEDTFDVNSTPWTKEAYESNKWAFVSDYVRLYALKTYGGVYLDTDVEIISDFSHTLCDKSFVSCFVEGCLVTCGFIACEKGNSIIESFFNYYKDRHFFTKDSNLDTKMNPLIFTAVIVKNTNLKYGAKKYFENGVAIYPHYYFMPYKKNMFMEKTNHKSYKITKHTYCIHHDLGSWSTKGFSKAKAVARLVLPEKFYLLLKSKKFKKEIKHLATEVLK